MAARRVSITTKSVDGYR